MRALFVLAGIAILFAGGHSAELAETAETRNVEVGENTEFSIFSMNPVAKCYLETANGDTVEFIPTDESNEKYQKNSQELFECAVRVSNLDENDSGSWILYAEDTSGTKSRMFNLTVNPLPVADNIAVEYLTEEKIETKLGADHEVVIRQGDPSFQTTESCDILTPSGMQYPMSAFRMDGVDLYSSDNVACGIKIKVQNGDVVGRWTLIATISTFGARTQMRLPFTIHVEETVDTNVDEILIAAGSDFYIRLSDATNEHETCVLKGPNGVAVSNYEVDPRYEDSCGYVVKNVNINEQGTWEIVYGKTITYRAPFKVTLTHGAENAITSSDVTLTLDRPASINVGPENAIYCRVTDPLGYLVSEGFGRCNITLDRVTLEHRGTWRISYGLQGQVLTNDEQITVSVVEAATKPVVTTSVVANKPVVTLTCSVASSDPVRTCKFRKPSGKVLIATEGVGESRYSFHGRGVSYSSGVHTHECGIQITDPVVSDLGLWRCGVETEAETYFGFLSVLCPWALRDPEVAAEVIQEPTLRAERDEITAVTGDTVSMMCSVQAPIRYCYFRARNGTVFNLEPGQTLETATYLGAGLDAGECGARFSGLAASDSGSWSCHVGLVEHHVEQRANIALSVHDAMSVEQHQVGSQLHIEAQVYRQSALEYCRFVRIDGVGFTNEDEQIPEGYHSIQNLATGRCGLVVEHPTMLDHHPWTVVARVKGQEELSRVTGHTIEIPGGFDPESDHPVTIVYFRTPYVWIVLMSLGLVLILIATLTGPKKNREWTFGRARTFRDSFRRSFLKKTISENDQRSTAIAA
ncbi:uncharacterized protein LOC121736141 isoform X1 [Aricia agestis]|uniref:uncharacterized protein LOC121736141 isoform X1 n=1 Tax=Aricia agestis TaxID=91739 RepID=UPI001C20A3E7|nr:uncharacterized protein LOC121736141 isoform X1 [Aricia agestis]